MMSPQLGQAALRIIMFLVVTALLMLPFVKPQSAEFVVLILTLTVGVVCGLVLFVFMRRQSR
jgi:diacylglycerol kinase